MRRNLRGIVLMTIGTLLILGAAGLFAYNCWDDYRAGAESEAAVQVLIDEIRDLAAGESQENALPADSLGFTEGEETEAQETGQEASRLIDLDGASYIGILTIPALDLTLPIQNELTMPNLRVSPCLYYGGPTEKSMVIAAHNYKRHFGRLGTLTAGAEVVFTDIMGNQTRYMVAEILTVEPTDVEEAVNSEYGLTLLTCNRSTRARVIVHCVLQQTAKNDSQ